MNQLTVTQIFLNGSVEYQFIPKNVCCKIINITVDADLNVLQVEIVGGCDGNRKAVARLVEGLSIPQVINKLKGITCGNKSTSCADQLAIACEMILNRR
jgi:uncharacterized protein (TIGR03905 family)